MKASAKQLGPHGLLKGNKDDSDSDSDSHSDSDSDSSDDDDDNQFILSKKDNLAIHNYIFSMHEITLSEDGNARYSNLARSLDQYKSHIDAWPPFMDTLINACKGISDHSQATIDILEQLQQHAKGEKELKDSEVKGMLQDLGANADSNGAIAEDAVSKVTVFRGNIEVDKQIIDEWVKVYEPQLQQDEKEEADEIRALNKQKRELIEANKEYERLLKYKPSLPFYEYVFPGIAIALWIAGRQENKLLQNAMDALTDQKNKFIALRKSLKGLSQDVLFLRHQHETAGKLADVLKDFVPLVSRIRGEWNAIKDDYNNLSDFVPSREEIKHSWEIKSALKRWKQLKSEVDSFHTTAKVVIKPQ